MFRLGDFYETFDDDAKIVSSVRNIVLTAREMGTGNRVPLAGVPIMRLRYLSNDLLPHSNCATMPQEHSPFHVLPSLFGSASRGWRQSQLSEQCANCTRFVLANLNLSHPVKVGLTKTKRRGSRRVFLDEPLFEGDGDGLRAIARAQLGGDLFDLALNRTFTPMDLPGHLLGCCAIRH